MATKLFVGGLAWATTDDGLKNMFSQVGQVVSATVISDKFSGRSKGFGFVEMSTEEEAANAIKQFNGAELDGRKIIVNEAKPKPEGGDFRPRSGGFGGGHSDFGGNRGGDRGGRGGYRSGGNRGGGYR